MQARESDRAWSTLGADFGFEILPPWYRTWRFIGICALTPLLLAVVRMPGAMKRECDLLRIVEEKTVDLRRANDDLLRLSSLDPLTGIANRRVFDQTIGKECARLNRAESPVSLPIIDVDHFKALNDSLGHLCGDEYLVAVGAALRRLARREVDVAARYGGEEFALILPDTDPAGTARFADTATQEWCRKPDEWIAAADCALYRAKGAGGIV